MNQRFLFIISLLLIGACSTGQDKGTPNDLSRGVASIDDVYACSLVAVKPVINGKIAEDKEYCSAIRTSDHFLITAAQCDPSAQQALSHGKAVFKEVIVQCKNGSGEVDSQKVEQFWFHPWQNGSRKEYDIALIKTEGGSKSAIHRVSLDLVGDQWMRDNARECVGVTSRQRFSVKVQKWVPPGVTVETQNQIGAGEAGGGIFCRDISGQLRLMGVLSTAKVVDAGKNILSFVSTSYNRQWLEYAETQKEISVKAYARFDYDFTKLKLDEVKSCLREHEPKGLSKKSIKKFNDQLAKLEGVVKKSHDAIYSEEETDFWKVRADLENAHEGLYDLSEQCKRF